MIFSKMSGGSIERIKAYIKVEGIVMSNQNLGLVSISFRSKSPEELVVASKEAGLNCIEWGSDVHAPKDDIKKLEDIVKLQEKYNIKCCSYGTYFKIGETPLEEIETYIAAAKTLGTDILRLWCGTKNSEEYTVCEKEKLFEECKKLADIAFENKVMLCMECHGGTFTNLKESALELMQTVNSSNFQMYWQPNAWITFEENLKYAQLIAPFTKALHIFNWEKGERFVLEESVIQWQKYYSCFDSSVNKLLEFLPNDDINLLPNETESLKKIVRGN